MPTFTTPPTFSSGEVLTAADINVLGDDISYLYQQSTQVAFYGTRLTASGSVSATNNTATDIAWDAETFDVGSWWSSGAAITVPAIAVPDGFTSIVLLVTARARFAANGTGSRTVRFLKDGATWSQNTTTGITGEQLDMDITDFITAVSGTVVKLQAVQSSGGTLDVSNLRISVVRFAAIS